MLVVLQEMKELLDVGVCTKCCQVGTKKEKKIKGVIEEGTIELIYAN